VHHGRIVKRTGDGSIVELLGASPHGERQARVLEDYDRWYDGLRKARMPEE
jgi:hypothetical protein